jgi:hypothetical protein
MVKRLHQGLHSLAKSVGIVRHLHEEHPMTLRRLILISCVFSLVMVTIASWIFYNDPRSKYDLVRPGRRTLPDSFVVDQNDSSGGETTKSDVKIEIQKLQSQVNGLDIYGNFKDDALSDYKVLQGYLDQPILDQ